MTAPPVVLGPTETPIGDDSDRRRWYWQPWLRDRPGRAAEGGSAERFILATVQIGRPIGTGRARRPRRLVARSLVDHSGNLWQQFIQCAMKLAACSGLLQRSKRRERRQIGRFGLRRQPQRLLRQRFERSAGFIPTVVGRRPAARGTPFARSSRPRWPWPQWPWPRPQSAWRQCRWAR